MYNTDNSDSDNDSADTDRAGLFLLPQCGHSFAPPHIKKVIRIVMTAINNKQ